jgi:myo-inositol-1(or 4)-monophosphatase
LPASDPVRLSGDLQTVMREAGDVARETARRPFRQWTKNGDRSPVCEGDIAVNDLLKVHLPQLVPQAGWVSEESAEQRAAPGQHSVWIVDPIDGTRAYIAGRADWTISVALVEKGRPHLVALYAPVTDEMFVAVRERGATLNGSPITISAGTTLAGARLAGPKRTLERIAGLRPEVQPQPKVFSLALRLARVAQGALDAAFASHGGHDWDLAAADLLVHEAGGVMTDFTGRPLRYNQPRVAHDALIAAGPARHRALVDLVRDRRTEFT